MGIKDRDKRKSFDDIKNQLPENNFFQAIRLIDRYYQSKFKSTTDKQTLRLFDNNYLLFKTAQSIVFPITSITDIKYTERPTQPFEEITIYQAFLSLTSPNGILPDHITDLLHERLHKKDYVLADFLDIFTHRSLVLLYHAWSKTRFYVGYETLSNPYQKDPTLQFLLSIIGYSKYSLQIPEDLLISHSGLLLQKQRDLEGLIKLLKSYFGMPFQIKPFCGKWIKLDPTQCFVLGKNMGQNHQLNINTRLGNNVWIMHNDFNIEVEPLAFENYCLFLPNQKKLTDVADIVRFYVGIEFCFSIKLTIRFSEVPRCQLRKKNPYHLGWTTWLKSSERTKNQLLKGYQMECLGLNIVLANAEI